MPGDGEAERGLGCDAAPNSEVVIETRVFQVVLGFCGLRRPPSDPISLREFGGVGVGG